MADAPGDGKTLCICGVAGGLLVLNTCRCYLVRAGGLVHPGTAGRALILWSVCGGAAVIWPEPSFSPLTECSQLPPCGVFSDPGLPWDAEHGEKQGSPLPIKLGLGYYEAFATLFPPLGKLDCSPLQMTPVCMGTSLPHSFETKEKPQLGKCSAVYFKN